LLRLQHGPTLNAPWGIALAPGDFGTFSHRLLIGNVGVGRIHAFNLVSGKFEGTLLNADGTPLSIDRLWALSFGGDSARNGLAIEGFSLLVPTVRATVCTAKKSGSFGEPRQFGIAIVICRDTSKVGVGQSAAHLGTGPPRGRCGRWSRQARFGACLDKKEKNLSTTLVSPRKRWEPCQRPRILFVHCSGGLP
jgi:hypothetical protein